MIVNGIIAEYNPFHSGHLYHMKKSAELTGSEYSIVVMSGSFTQRGEPAVWDKWTRAEIAVKQGADIVLEIPFAFACNSAEHFSRGAVDILEALGCVTCLSFGSETGELETLKKIAELQLGNSLYDSYVSESMKKGLSYPRAVEEAVCEILNEDHSGILRAPNNILCIEYIKRIIENSSDIMPLAIKRVGSGYSDERIICEYPSAAAIRKALREGVLDIPALPYDGRKVLKRGSCLDCDDILYSILRAEILRSDETELKKILSVDEGIENILKKAVRRCESLDDLIDALSGKRYTRARIRRMLIHIITGFEKKDFSPYEHCGYSRILAFSERGSKLLKKIKKSSKESSFKLLTNINREAEGIGRLFKYDIRATDLYNMLSGSSLYENCEFMKTPGGQKLEKEQST